MKFKQFLEENTNWNYLTVIDGDGINYFDEADKVKCSWIAALECYNDVEVLSHKYAYIEGKSFLTVVLMPCDIFVDMIEPRVR